MMALIVNFNRLTLAKQMAEQCLEYGFEPVFVDNNSDYEPLLEYYHQCPYMVMHLNKNYGHTVVWNREASVLERLGITGRYVVTDPDLDLRGVPSDLRQVLSNGLDMYGQYDKCGVSLELSDLPWSTEGAFIRRHEQAYWEKPLAGGYWDAPVDTTFAMYREGVMQYNHNGIRSGRPYTARHLPWYYLGLSALPADEQNYYRTANASSSGKNRMPK